jgi:thiol-disulfide isomerase/thioredoxin
VSVLRRRVTAPLAVLLVLVLAGCSGGSRGTVADPLAMPSLAPVGVDADTPKLRRLKARAGIETCTPGPLAGGAGQPDPSTASSFTPSSGTLPSGTLPSVTLPCLGGGPDVDLSALRGPLVVNVWGSWCAPCRDELPILAAFYAEHGDHVAMLGVDFQDTRPEDALELAEISGVTYPQLFDHDGAIGRTAVMPGPAVPALAFVDAAGVVTAWVPGEVKSQGQLLELVSRHLGVDL